jgi:hypothetical protein
MAGNPGPTNLQAVSPNHRTGRKNRAPMMKATTTTMQSTCSALHEHDYCDMILLHTLLFRQACMAFTAFTFKDEAASSSSHYL